MSRSRAGTPVRVVAHLAGREAAAALPPPGRASRRAAGTAAERAREIRPAAEGPGPFGVTVGRAPGTRPGVVAAEMTAGSEMPRGEAPPAPFAGLEPVRARGDMAAPVPQSATASLEAPGSGAALTAVIQCSTRRGIGTGPTISVLGEQAVRAAPGTVSAVDTAPRQVRGVTRDLSGRGPGLRTALDESGKGRRRGLPPAGATRIGLAAPTPTLRRRTAGSR
ncbi:hypothetical protein [Streptomyces sp. NPDC020983]|uniref:hypothetical protein n=1 Tax=Streptomyces sp. NPDC020983 TaxID=3365106 RepID=UPI0037B34938